MTLTSSLPFRAAEVGTPCVAAWLTSLRVSQVTFPVILLFPFREHERSTTLRTRDFKVWHRGFSTRVKTRTFTLLLFGALALRFFQPQDVARKRCFINARRKPVPTVTLLVSVLQQFSLFNFFVKTFCRKVLRKISTPAFSVAHAQHVPTPNRGFSLGIRIAHRFAKHEQTLS